MTENISAPLDEFKERELEILSLIVDGKSNQEIADQLYLTKETIRWYNKQIYSKLGVHNRVHAIIRCQEWNLLEDTPSDSPLEQPFSNLPEYPSSFVGRDAELANVIKIIEEDDARLITITGAGGMGKTRLAVEVARDCMTMFKDGVFFVPLSQIAETTQILPAISRRLNLNSDAGPDQLLRYLRDKDALLILDTFEHLMDGATIVSELLAATRYLTIIVTSRYALNLQAEWVRVVEAVPIPPPSEPIVVDGAFQLFEDRARRIIPDFSVADDYEAVRDICELVDGMPLAIELATSWLKVLTCAAIAREIRQNIDFLATEQRDVTERHQSIRAVFNQSWDLLSTKEKKVLGRLSFFRGGFSLQTAQQVAHASIDTLMALVDKSLIRYDAKGHQHFQSGHYHLHDLLRQYVEEKLVRTTTGKQTTRTGMLITWSAFMRGDFERVQEIVEDILKPSAEISTDFEKEAFALALSGTLAGLIEDYASCQQRCESSLTMVLRHEIPDPITLMFARLGVAIAGCGRGHYHIAQQSIRSALSLAQKMDTPAFSLLCLPVIIITKAHEAEFETATQLLSFFYDHPANIPTWLQRWRLLEELESSFQDELGAESFNQHWEHGKSLFLPSVIEALLSEHD